ncbi:MAG: hypothetical protein P9X24_06040 [Candidatus Hatepunaea meridiana]|nr:hypothetical protein [Candidatus Hatepunaea meridiana]
MNNTIQVGNDEFILYIRKNHQCSIRNNILGRRIWQWIHANANGIKLGRLFCCWRNEELCTNPSGYGFPKSATQFRFDRSTLPALYTFLDELVTTHKHLKAYVCK